MPEDNPLVQPGLAGLGNPAAWIHLGLTGWHEPRWRGLLYPAGTGGKDFLSYYSRSYATVELNSTFYALPSPQQVARWCSVVPASFHFIPKVPRSVSHALTEPSAHRDWQAFQELLPEFGLKAPAVFLQLSPATGPAQVSAVLRLLDQWHSPARLFLEVRHPDLVDHPALLSALAERGMGLVITDVAGHRELLHLCLPAPRTLIRFVACGDQGTDSRRIEAWVHRLRQWAERGLEEAWFFCHTLEQAQAPALSRHFRNQYVNTFPTGEKNIPPITDYASAQKDLFEASR